MLEVGIDMRTSVPIVGKNGVRKSTSLNLLVGGLVQLGKQMKEKTRKQARELYVFYSDENDDY